MIYLDSAATTPIADEVFEAMLPWLKGNFGNPGSMYKAGRDAKSAIEKARGQVARLFNASPENIIFTSGGSEGNSFAFQAAAERLEASGKKHILVSAVEHDSVLRAAESLTKRGFHVDYLPVCRGGSVRFESVKQAITPETGLISIMYVNNETGAINLLDEVGQLCCENDILFHTDCVQAAGFLSIDVEKIQCDYATVSAHKFHGPKGVGCVYVREPQESSPLIHGGHGQEFSLRGGTENVPGIVGMGEAAEITTNTMIETQELLWDYRIKFWQKLSDELGDSIHLNGQWLAPSKVLNVRVDGVDADTIVLAMDASGVCVSAGSACRSYELEPSETLMAMGLTADEARNSVRISFSSMNTENDIIDAADAFICCVRTLRGDTYDF